MVNAVARIPAKSRKKQNIAGTQMENGGRNSDREGEKFHKGKKSLRKRMKFGLLWMKILIWWIENKPDIIGIRLTID